jgi:hypothetical protein
MPPGMPMPPPLGGPIAVDPAPAQPAMRRTEIAIDTLVRDIVLNLLAVFGSFIVFGLADIYRFEHQKGRGVPRSPRECC